eukprot:TRINITY_DN2732_c0_g1_i1.p1 TRINITY_DN2732_c0_g1~~TRINITY_DN2732_c0_g1_i1.p1  ORF type:complete len:268 (-),score=37.20 TRINITY_DN2732_c0_g1_i1:76-879(-)
MSGLKVHFGLRATLPQEAPHLRTFPVHFIPNKSTPNIQPNMATKVTKRPGFDQFVSTLLSKMPSDKALQFQTLVTRFENNEISDRLFFQSIPLIVDRKIAFQAIHLYMLQQKQQQEVQINSNFIAKPPSPPLARTFFPEVPETPVAQFGDEHVLVFAGESQPSSAQPRPKSIMEHLFPAETEPQSKKRKMEDLSFPSEPAKFPCITPQNFHSPLASLSPAIIDKIFSFCDRKTIARTRQTSRFFRLFLKLSAENRPRSRSHLEYLLS